MAQMRVRAVVLAACLAALIQTSLAGTSHTVGGTTGWTIPTSNSLYSTWAAKQTFKVGDTLVFNFQTGSHTVAEVSKSAYDACTTTNPISTAATGPASMTLSTAGSHYYICTISGHCNAGQKLAITAAAAPASAPTSTTSSAPSPSISAAPASTPAASTPSASPSSSPPAPSPASSAAPTAAEPTASIATSPESSTVPSAISPSSSSGTTAPAPSSATVAGAGLFIPVIMVAAAFLV